MSDFAQMEMVGGGLARPAGGDTKLWVKFVRRSRINAAKSEAAGRPIHEACDYVQIQQPGERDRVDRPVTEWDKARFPRHWAQYQQQIEQTAEGTPVQYIFPTQPEVVELLADIHVDTVEQLAGLGETGIERLGMNGRRHVERAKAALDKSASVQEVAKLSRAIDELTEQNKILTDANVELGRRIDALRREPKENHSAPNEVPREAAPPMMPRRQRAEVVT